jgi:predicted nucleic acid-binding protein
MLIFTRGARLISSELVMADVPRALRRTTIQDPTFDLAMSLAKATIFLKEIVQYPVDHRVLRRAGMIFDPRLRALDGIHVATALDLRPIEAFVTYDDRQAKAARKAGLPTVSPRE